MLTKIISNLNIILNKQPPIVRERIQRYREIILDKRCLNDSQDFAEFINTISHPYISMITDAIGLKHWLEPLTIYDYQMRPIRENIPRGLVHELALPHGASDCLIYNPQTQKILLNIRQDDGHLEGIGGHKESGLTFKENMLKELLEELFSEAVQNSNHEFKNSAEFLTLRNIDLYSVLDLRLQEIYRSINANNKGGLLNIHVGALHILEVDTDLIAQFKPDKDSSAGMQWFSFAEIEELLHSESQEYAVLRTLWTWFKKSEYYREIKKEK
jgi:hypothetical protein